MNTVEMVTYVLSFCSIQIVSLFISHSLLKKRNKSVCFFNFQKDFDSCTKELVVQGFRVLKWSLLTPFQHRHTHVYDYCLGSTEYLIFYTKTQERKSKFWFLYQKIGCPGLQGIKLSLFTNFTLWKDWHTYISVWWWCFIEYLIFNIFYTKIEERKSKFWNLYQYISCPGLLVIKTFSICNSFTAGGQVYLCLW